MSRKLTSKCDGCGVEVVENDDATPTGILGVMRRRHGSENWGSLSVGNIGPFPVSFDLCEACTKRVVALLELEMPKPSTAQRGFGSHAMPFMPGDFMAPPWPPPMSPAPAFDGLSPEAAADALKALGIELPPGFGKSPMQPSMCTNCGAAYKGPRPKTCTMCGHVHD